MWSWDQEGIKQALLRGDITSQEAFELISKPERKPWESEEWEAIRVARIGQVCTQCGSTEPPLVLQHLWQPRGLKQLVARFRTQYRMEYEAAHPRPAVQAPEPKGERENCPSCGSISVVARKRTKDWRCNQCTRLFPQPGIKRVLTPQQAEKYELAQKQAYEKWNQTFFAEYAERFRRDAVLASIEDHQRYISCEDTTTFCKRCAFLWDVKRVSLCPVCRENYMSRHLLRCASCERKQWEGESLSW